MKASEKPAKRQPKSGSTWGHGKEPSSKTKTKKERDHRQLIATLAKVNITIEAVVRAPQITAILDDAEVDLETLLKAMRFSSDPNIEAFLQVYDEASDTDRRILPMEAFALMADVNITQLLGAMIIALRDQSASVVKIIATAAHPSVIRASIKNALKPGGVKDRNAIHTAMRLLPVSKGATIIMPHVGQLPGGGVVEIEGDDVNVDELFPNLETTQKMLTE